MHTLQDHLILEAVLLSVSACLRAGHHIQTPEENYEKQKAAAVAHKAQEGLQRAKEAAKKPVEDPEGTKAAAKESAGKVDPPN